MSLISMKRSFIDLRKCFSAQPKKGPPHSHPTRVLFQSELRFNVTSSELIEIVHRLFASPLCIFHFQLAATRTLALSHSNLADVLCIFLPLRQQSSSTSSSTSPFVILLFSPLFPPRLCGWPHGPRPNFDPWALRTLHSDLRRKHSNQSMAQWAVVNMVVLRSGGFISSISGGPTWVWNTLPSLLLLFIPGQGLLPVQGRHVQGGQVGLGHLLHSWAKRSRQVFNAS